MIDDRVSPAELVASLGLKAHPEGGFYKETYRSVDESAALPERFGPGRDKLAYCTSIYYLLEAPDYSAFHRIRSDELWYFHAGSGLVIHCLEPGGAYRALELGPGREYFAAVQAGWWFAAEPQGHRSAVAEPLGPVSAAAEPQDHGSAGTEPLGHGAVAARPWCLVGCAVSPGFDFRDFELAKRSALIMEYPEQAALIERLTRA